MASIDNSTTRPQQWLMDPALYLDDILTTSHCLWALLGIPVNVFVLGVVTFSQRLHSQRNFIWMGIGFSNLFILTFHLAEVLAVHWPSPTAGHICAWLLGLPHASLLLNFFLALLERRLCLKHTKWYKSHVTKGWILAGLVGSFLILCLAIKGRHLFDAAPLRWQSSPSDLSYLSTFVVAGFFLCLAGQATVWVTSSKSYPSTGEQPPEIALSPVAYDESAEEESQTASSAFVRIAGERVSRLDLEAARSITLSFVAFLCLAIPAFVTFVLLVGCVRYGWFLGEHKIDDCSQLVQTFYYFRELIAMFCSSISPAIFVSLSRDFRSILRDRRRAICPHYS